MTGARTIGHAKLVLINFRLKIEFVSSSLLLPRRVMELFEDEQPFEAETEGRR